MKYLAPLFLGLFTPLAAHAGTITVSPTAGPGIDFTTIQGAIDAAVEGDLIVVGNGAYQEHLLINGKSVTLVGQTSPNLFLTETSAGFAPNLTVENLGPNQEVHIVNLSVGRFGGPSADSIFLNKNEGRVWLEEIFVDTFNGHGMRVTDCDNVMLSEVFLQTNSAHTDIFGTHHPSIGLIVEDDSSVDAFSCQIKGSHGPPIFSTPTFPIEGGDGVVVIDSTLDMSDCKLQAGTGGTLFTGSCSIGAPAGSALAITTKGGPMPKVTTRGGTITGSSPGHFNLGCGPTPGVTPVIDDPLAAHTQLTGEPRILSMPSTPTSSGIFEFQVRGAADDLWFLYVSLDQASAMPIPGVVGDLFINPATSFRVLSGTLDQVGFGGKVVTYPNPGFPVIFHTQALFIDTAGGFWVSGPGSLASL